MSKKPIKSNLFRFVTLRSPELIENKETGFVQFPENLKNGSIYYQAISDATTDDEKKTALKEAHTNSSLNILETKNSVKNLHPNLYQFSSWLMKNKSYLSYDSILSNLPKHSLDFEDGKYVIALSDFQRTTVWDNLFYQTIQKKSVQVREALIQLLIANKFVKAFAEFTNEFSTGGDGEIVFTEENEKEFIRRANASVVISKDILYSNKVKDVEVTSKMPESKAKFLEDNLEATLAQERVDNYKQALKEIQLEKAKYEKENQKLYQEALDAHNTAVKQAISEETPTLVDVTDPDTGVTTQIKTYPDLVLPEFEYNESSQLKTFDENLAKEVVKPTTFSSRTLEILEDPKLNFLTDFNEAEEALTGIIKDDELLINNLLSGNEPTTSTIGGSTITTNPLFNYTKDPYCFVAVAYRRKYLLGSNDLLGNISMNITVPDNNTHIVSADYTLKNTSTNVEVQSAEINETFSSNKMLIVSFFKDGTEMLSGKTYEFSGTLVLDNGKELFFKETFFVTNSKFGIMAKFNGCFKVITSGNDDPVDDTNAPTLFGVTQLGIADFRRVEQEVCCYVPGEVSHIENIMAREYKEKATRLLNSHETTTEQTSERETENLTDTTSTERNEMQSEASSVLNQDNAQSFGANASVTSKFPGGSFSAGANYNSSSSNSSSISNSQAQTYAQEVTERVLERVVQKISSKRTSRILREYEENNTHGFDNRKGDSHVTGIYRWVDKIYKNKLINYGKRLMYEFSIPEPAKYLKKAIEKDENTSETNLGLLEPKKPAALTITSKGLNATNYQSWASKYGAEVEAFPNNIISISKSYSKDDHSINDGRFSHSGNEKLDIPKGYKLNSYKGYFTLKQGNHSGTWRRNGHIVVGGKKFDFHQVDYREISDSNPESTINSLEFSVSSWDVGSYAFNLVAKCSLTNEGLEQWQNETFKTIKDAYDAQVERYNEFKLGQQVGPTEEGGRQKFNPLFNRSMEKRELKRLAIELLTKSTNITVSKSSYTPGANETFVINANEELEQHASVIKFFEQAFDWEIMAYTFYPYFYADKEDWSKLFREQEEADPIFQAFLQSGMARSVVPVRPGFEDAVNWYMATGEIWNGQNLVTDVNDDLYVSVAEEMETIEGELEGTWETRVPTSLTLIQGKSAFLDEEGLPCGADCHDEGYLNPIKPGGVLIGDALDGVDFDTVGQDNTVA